MEIISEYCAICQKHINNLCDGKTCSCEEFISSKPLKTKNYWKHI